MEVYIRDGSKKAGNDVIVHLWPHLLFPCFVTAIQLHENNELN